MNVPPIVSGRFEMVSLSLEVIEWLLVGGLDAASKMLDVIFPDEGWLIDMESVLRYRRDDLLRDPGVQAWTVRAIVLPDRRMAGYSGFHGPPDPGGTCELGYTIFEQYRRQGFAHEAARCLMRWAEHEHGIQRFRVSIAPDNAPSLAMAEKLGFVRTGEQMDEIDGLEWTFELEIT